jgi:hypothetical protein
MTPAPLLETALIIFVFPHAVLRDHDPIRKPWNVHFVWLITPARRGYVITLNTTSHNSHIVYHPIIALSQSASKDRTRIPQYGLTRNKRRCLGAHKQAVRLERRVSRPAAHPKLVRRPTTRCYPLPPEASRQSRGASIKHDYTLAST